MANGNAFAGWNKLAIPQGQPFPPGWSNIVSRAKPSFTATPPATAPSKPTAAQEREQVTLQFSYGKDNDNIKSYTIDAPKGLKDNEIIARAMKADPEFASSYAEHKAHTAVMSLIPSLRPAFQKHPPNIQRRDVEAKESPEKASRRAKAGTVSAYAGAAAPFVIAAQASPLVRGVEGGYVGRKLGGMVGHPVAGEIAGTALMGGLPLRKAAASLASKGVGGAVEEAGGILPFLKQVVLGGGRINSAGDLASWKSEDLWARYMQEHVADAPDKALMNSLKRELARRGEVKALANEIRPIIQSRP